MNVYEGFISFEELLRGKIGNYSAYYAHKCVSSSRLANKFEVLG